MTEPLPDDTVLLLRRAGPDTLDPADKSIRHSAFRLRPSRGELSLSFYDSTLADPEAVLIGAPTQGWGVVGITAGRLRALGFTVVRDPVATGDRLGAAHVAATPPALDEGQVPLRLREAAARMASWLVRPDATA